MKPKSIIFFLACALCVNIYTAKAQININTASSRKNIFQIETNGSAAFSLIDQSEKILLNTNINGRGIINISGKAPGLYYLKNNSTQPYKKLS